jgi:hypothetical protein
MAKAQNSGITMTKEKIIKIGPQVFAGNVHHYLLLLELINIICKTGIGQVARWPIIIITLRHEKLQGRHQVQQDLHHRLRPNAAATIAIFELQLRCISDQPYPP